MANAGQRLGVVLLVSGLACGGSSPPPDDPSASPAADQPGGGDATPAGKDGTDAKAPADGDAPAAATGEASGSQELARDLIKAGGRFVGWSASKKSFVHPQ